MCVSISEQIHKSQDIQTILKILKVLHFHILDSELQVFHCILSQIYCLLFAYEHHNIVGFLNTLSPRHSSECVLGYRCGQPC